MVCFNNLNTCKVPSYMTPIYLENSHILYFHDYVFYVDFFDQLITEGGHHHDPRY